MPYNRATTLYDDAARGVIVETFDERSWRPIDVGDVIPLLVHHDASRPIGRITRVRHSDDGLRVEARLAASPDELAGIAARVDAGVQAGLSMTSSQQQTPVTCGPARRRPACHGCCATTASSSRSRCAPGRPTATLRWLELRTRSIGNPDAIAAELAALERRHAGRRLDDRLARIGVRPTAAALHRLSSPRHHQRLERAHSAAAHHARPLR